MKLSNSHNQEKPGLWKLITKDIKEDGFIVELSLIPVFPETLADAKILLRLIQDYLERRNSKKYTKNRPLVQKAINAKSLKGFSSFAVAVINNVSDDVDDIDDLDNWCATLGLILWLEKGGFRIYKNNPK